MPGPACIGWSVPTALTKTFVPYGAYWSSPFCRWQGSIGHLHSLELAAQTAGRFLPKAGIAVGDLDSLVLGFTVPQRHAFDGAPWVAATLGAPGITGPVVAQACATSARVLATAAAEIDTGQRRSILGLACDRTSDGPSCPWRPCRRTRRRSSRLASASTT